MTPRHVLEQMQWELWTRFAIPPIRPDSQGIQRVRGLATIGAVRSPNRSALDAMIDEATVDCDNDSECVTGFYTMLDERLDVPFQTCVLGVDVTVTGIDLTDDERIVATCVRGRWRQRIPILDLPLPVPPPGGAEWIEAYRHWLK